MKPRYPVAKAEASGPTTREDRRESQIERILAAAQCCFGRSGFRGASMQEICARADMSPGALYRYFPSKEAIVGAITEVHKKDEVFPAVPEGGSVVDVIVDGAMGFFERVTKHGTSSLIAEVISESMRNEAIDEVREKGNARVFEAMQEALSAASERDEIDPVISLDHVPQVLVMIAESFAINERWRQSIDTEELRTILDTVVSGLLRPKNRKAA